MTDPNGWRPIADMLRSFMRNRCYACGWPLKANRDDGCVPFDCSFRPSEAYMGYHGWRERMGEMQQVAERVMSAPPVAEGSP